MCESPNTCEYHYTQTPASPLLRAPGAQGRMPPTLHRMASAEMPRMMLRKRLDGIGLLGVPPRPTYSSLSFAFIASDTSPGLRSGAAGAGAGSCVGRVAWTGQRNDRYDGGARGWWRWDDGRTRRVGRAGGVGWGYDGGVRRPGPRAREWWHGDRTSSGAASSWEPARMASSALTVFSASDLSARHTARLRAAEEEGTRATSDLPRGTRTARFARLTVTRGRAAVATTAADWAMVTAFMLDVRWWWTALVRPFARSCVFWNLLPRGSRVGHRCTFFFAN